MNKYIFTVFLTVNRMRMRLQARSVRCPGKPVASASAT